MSEDKHPEDIVEVADLLADICGEAKALAKKTNHEIVMTAKASLRLRGDRRELRSAFSNLVFNAVNHTPNGTRVALCWDGDGEGASFTVSNLGGLGTTYCTSRTAFTGPKRVVPAARAAPGWG